MLIEHFISSSFHSICQFHLMDTNMPSYLTLSSWQFRYNIIVCHNIMSVDIGSTGWVTIHEDSPRGLASTLLPLSQQPFLGTYACTVYLPYHSAIYKHWGWTIMTSVHHCTDHREQGEKKIMHNVHTHTHTHTSPAVPRNKHVFCLQDFSTRSGQSICTHVKIMLF